MAKITENIELLRVLKNSGFLEQSRYQKSQHGANTVQTRCKHGAKHGSKSVQTLWGVIGVLPITKSIDGSGIYRVTYYNLRTLLTRFHMESVNQF